MTVVPHRILLASLALCALDGSARAQDGEITTTVSTDPEPEHQPCPKPSGEAVYNIHIEDKAESIVHSYAAADFGQYIQTVIIEWDICTDCPNATMVWMPIWEIWVLFIDHQQCTQDTESYVEWWPVPKPAQGNVAETADNFTLVGGDKGREILQTGTDKYVIGSDADGYGVLFETLARLHDEATRYRGTIKGQRVRTRVISGPNLPPTYPHADEYGGRYTFVGLASASLQMPAPLQAFLDDPNNAEWIIEGNDTHKAQLLWTCCSPHENVRFKATVE